MLITFEGGEGSGKSTQARILYGTLSQVRETVLVREPGGTPFGERIRHIIMDHPEIPTLAQLCLFIAARSVLVREVIKPSLKEGKIVICDRYIDSTLVIQGYAKKIPLQFIRVLNMMAIKNAYPDLTFLLDVDPQVGLQRKQETNTLDQLAVEHGETYRRAYYDLMMIDPQRWRFIPATVPADLASRYIHGQVVTHRKF